MRKVFIVFVTLAIMLLGVGLVNACTKEGYVFCDVNRNGEIDPEDTPMEGVKVIIVNEFGTWYGEEITDANGHFFFNLNGDSYVNYFETLDESTLPDDFAYAHPDSGLHTFYTTPTERHFYNEWLIDSDSCREGLCWLTGGGVKFEPMLDSYMAEKGPKDSLGGNVYPGCNPDSGDGGQWNHIAHRLKLHFQGWTIHVEECGNVPGIDPGSESPETPYNYIEFTGTGTLKGIKGNKVDHGTVFFFGRCEDRNEPGSNGAKDGEDIDRYFLHVFDSAGNTLMLIDEDGDPETKDPVTITGGNLQIHISSCDTPPM